jgi:hypothetical protein
MLNTVWAVVHEGRIETLGEVDAPEGTRALYKIWNGWLTRKFGLRF